MLRTLDDCPEYLLQYSEVESEARGASSVPTSPVRRSGAAVLDRGGSTSLPGSPLQNRSTLGSGRKPPLSPGKHLQVRASVMHARGARLACCLLPAAVLLERFQLNGM